MTEKYITSADSVITLAVPGLGIVPQTLSGYAVDKAFMTDAIDMTETSMGVDGHMAVGYTPNITTITFSFQADSPSIELFKTIIATMKLNKQPYIMQGIITLPSLGETYTLTRGVLKSAHQFPSGAKVLQELDYLTHWELVTASPL